MAVKIKLKRIGARNQPSYRIVVIDSRKKRDGKNIERLGFYDPKPSEAVHKIDEEKAIYWLEKGAIPSDTVKSLLKQDGILAKLHAKKHGVAEPEEVQDTEEEDNNDKDKID